jgi:hypothetical protein
MNILKEEITRGKNKIIFLDIDGVLNVYENGSDEFGKLFYKQYEENLRRIIEETGADIVISSTWRYAGLDKMQLMWEMRDLPGRVIGITPFFREHLTKRGEEIAEWIRENNISNYCIIDDCADMLPEQEMFFVKTAKNFEHEDSLKGIGLTKKCAEKAIEILNKK